MYCFLQCCCTPSRVIDYHDELETRFCRRFHHVRHPTLDLASDLGITILHHPAVEIESYCPLSWESALSRNTTFPAGLYELSSAHIWGPEWFILYDKTNHGSRLMNCKT